MKLKGLALAIILVLNFVLSVGLSAPVKAESAPVITLSPISGNAGTAIIITGNGFTANTAGYIWFDTNGNGIKDADEPSRMLSTTSTGAIPEFTRLTVPKAPAGNYKIECDIQGGGNIKVSANFTITPNIVLSQQTGYSGMPVNITGSGFTANASGYIWFDTDGDRQWESNEPRVSVTCDNAGTLPDGITLMTPATGPGTYSVLADLPDNGEAEASATFTYTPTLVLNPSPVTSNLGSVVMNTIITIKVSGGGFTPNTSGYIWFDYNNNGKKDTDESQSRVTITAQGTIPSGIALKTPKLSSGINYNVLADIGNIKTSAILSVADTTTSVTINKRDPYGNIISSKTVSWQWMKAHLPIIGDKTTDYYIQKGTAESDNFDDVWDPQETNTDSLLEMGCSEGSDVKDLLNLVGGASWGDTILFTASDGWQTEYDYENIYNPDPRQGKVVLAWWNSLSGGYVPDFYLGMRLFCLTETTNATGQHIYGDWDMHETLPPDLWQFSPIGPASSRLSEEYVKTIDIYEPNLYACDASGNPTTNFAAGQTVYVKGIGLTPNNSYKLWIQPNGVLISPLGPLDLPTGAYVLSTANDPAGSQEMITTDSKGDYPPTAIWTLGSSAHSPTPYDIIADNQSVGIVGTFDTADALANPNSNGLIAYSSAPSDNPSSVKSMAVTNAHSGIFCWGLACSIAALVFVIVVLLIILKTRRRHNQSNS
jgi:hypothetical protein